MSIRVMAAVYDSELTDVYETSVMLALANHADDQGVCYPSIRRIAKLSRMGERGVQGVIKRLSERGYITIEMNAGRGGTNRYTVHPDRGGIGVIYGRDQSQSVRKKGKSKKHKLSVNRFTIFARDNYTCRYCGFKDVSQGNDAGAMLHVDHAKPRASGGADDMSNLRTSCIRCNLMKGEKSEADFLLDPRIKCTPHPVHPAPHAPLPPHPVTNTPAPHAPETSLTINEPSVIDKARVKKMRLPDDWVPTQDDVDYAISQKLNETEIKEIADDFHAYWSDRTDAGGKKSERGWRQTWRNRIRDQAPKFIRNRNMAGKASPGGYGQGRSIASVAAQRWAND